MNAARQLGIALLLLAGLAWTASAGAVETPSPTPTSTVLPAGLLGPTAAPRGLTTTAQEAVFVENSTLGDFEVHFFVSLPFTALYSYVVTLSLDSLVQGKFPPEFRQADSWMVMGLAVGSSLAVALGSVGQVPDQTKYQPPDPTTKNDSGGEDHDRHMDSAVMAKMELVRIVY